MSDPTVYRKRWGKARDAAFKYKKNKWVVMTEDTTTTFDEICLPTFEEVTLTIVRKVSEAERKKSHQDSIKRGGCFSLKYSELKKLL